MRCKHCGREIRPTYDPAVPWVHEDSHNAYCDVSDPLSAVFALRMPAAERYETDPT